METYYFELLNTILTLFNVVLATKQKIIKWPIGIVATFAGLVVYYQTKLYGKCLISVASIVLSFYGWYHWRYGGKNRQPLEVSRTRFRHLVRLLALGTFATFALGEIFARFTEANFTHWDSFCTCFSLIGRWMSARKELECWIIRLVVDIMYMNIFLSLEKYILAVKYLICAFIAIYGYFAWRKSYMIKKRFE